MLLFSRFFITPFQTQRRIVYVFISAIIVACAVLLCVVPAQEVEGTEEDAIKEKIREAEQRIQALQEQQGEYKSEISKHQHEAASLQEQVSEFNHQIQDLELRIAITEQEVSTVRLYIEKTTLEINSNELLIEQKRTQITSLFRTIHRQSNKTVIELVLENDSLSDFFDEIQAQESIQQSIHESVKSLKILQERLENQRVKLLLDQERLVKLEEELDAQNQVLAQQREVQQDLLTQTKNSQRSYERLLQEAESQEKALNEEIFNLEEELRKLLNPASIPAGDFHWPTSGVITQHYGCIHTAFARRAYSLCNNGRGGFHNGLDMSAPLGTSIYSVADGTVIDAASSRSGYGRWVAVRHTNGLVTVYAHLSAVTASPGQAVKRGDVIARMGSTGFSTGSHLHFIVYAPNSFKVVSSRRTGTRVPIGATVTPFNYLPHTAVGKRVRI